MRRTLSLKPEPPSYELGLILDGVTKDELAAGVTGIFVRAVQRDTPAERAGLMAGDQLLAVSCGKGDTIPLNDRPMDFATLAIKSCKKAEIKLQVERNTRAYETLLIYRHNEQEIVHHTRLFCDPGDVEQHLRKADNLFLRQEFKEAKKEALSALAVQVTPGEFQRLTEVGDAVAGLKLTKSLVQDSLLKKGGVFYMLALVYAKLDNPIGAQQCLRKAVKLTMPWIFAPDMKIDLHDPDFHAAMSDKLTTQKQEFVAEVAQRNVETLLRESPQHFASKAEKAGEQVSMASGGDLGLDRGSISMLPSL